MEIFMKNRILGKDLEVSPIGLGCMGFSHAYGTATDEDTAINAIRQAVEMGYTFFDTAECYIGEKADGSISYNEELVGKALAPYRNQVKVATKCGVKHENLFPVLEELNIGYVAFSPLANGILSDAFAKGEQFDKADYRSAMPQYSDEAFEQNRELLSLIRNLAEEKNATPAQISLAWMLCKKPYIVPIPGSRKAERIRENLGAAEIALTADEVMSIDKKLDHMEMSAVFGGSPVKK